MAGVPVTPDVWDDLVLPGHLRPRYRVVGEGRTLAEGDDLRELERRLRAHVRATVVSQAPELERSGLTSWPSGTLPRVVESTVDRSAERRVGKGGVRQCRSRWGPD